jgi:hypothetical protein
VGETLHFASRLAGAPPGNEAEARVNTLLLLSAGKTHYFVAISPLVDYYASIGVTVPGRANPADLLLELVNTDFAQNQAAASERELVADLASRWDRSALRQQSVEAIASVRSAEPELALDAAECKPSFLAVLTHRSVIKSYRDGGKSDIELDCDCARGSRLYRDSIRYE